MLGTENSYVFTRRPIYREDFLLSTFCEEFCKKRILGLKAQGKMQFSVMGETAFRNQRSEYNRHNSNFAFLNPKSEILPYALCPMLYAPPNSRINLLQRTTDHPHPRPPRLSEQARDGGQASPPPSRGSEPQGNYPLP